MHSVPKGSESHFKVTIASAEFVGKSLVDRHRQVYGILAEELQHGVHALALHTYSPEEWSARSVPTTPDCLGGKK